MDLVWPPAWYWQITSWVAYHLSFSLVVSLADVAFFTDRSYTLWLFAFAASYWQGNLAQCSMLLGGSLNPPFQDVSVVLMCVWLAPFARLPASPYLCAFPASFVPFKLCIALRSFHLYLFFNLCMANYRSALKQHSPSFPFVICRHMRGI